ncbi:MAG: hypothetical protein M1818_008248 [Claussenomyces sp. TS43310]|nr:MAG: hypothetical protein M1818_008248 [Claussenomyces sp. TS43310]
MGQNESTVPPGPPPDHAYAPPAKPPPSYSGPSQTESYSAPAGTASGNPGPLSEASGQEYAPPPGPPPSYGPQHDWQTAVPDTSMLPPPPMLGYERSPTNNASEDDAKRAESWCRSRPLQVPFQLSPADLSAVALGDMSLIKSPVMLGDLKHVSSGLWNAKVKRHSPDSCILTTLPVYSPLAHSPLRTHCAKTIYFEVQILREHRSEVPLGLGFVATPYPPFRLPGWERASLGVHGDDGHRYVNDKWGGKDFTAPFKGGQRVGIGMTFSRRKTDTGLPYGVEEWPAQTEADTPIKVDVFFTRDGQQVGNWNLHEENDAQQDLPVTGLEGMNDLYAAVGTFESVTFDIIFNPNDWLYHP